MLATVNPRGSKKDHGILNVLRSKPAKGLKIFGKNAKRSRFFAFQEFTIEIGKRLEFHGRHFAMFLGLDRRSRASPSSGGGPESMGGSDLEEV
jgi:hypothetical protein